LAAQTEHYSLQASEELANDWLGQCVDYLLKIFFQNDMPDEVSRCKTYRQAYRLSKQVFLGK